MKSSIQTDRNGFPLRRDEDKIFVGRKSEADQAWDAYFSAQAEENSWRTAH